MAHKTTENGKVVVDWETGDKEGDRKFLFQAYQDFIKELLYELNGTHHNDADDHVLAISNVINKWEISVDNQVDDFPRIWIKRP